MDLRVALRFEQSETFDRLTRHGRSEDLRVTVERVAEASTSRRSVTDDMVRDHGVINTIPVHLGFRFWGSDL